MSVRVMSLVWESDLPPMEKLVLLALADAANDEGHCWPSAATVMRKSGQSERTVRRCIQTLITKRHLTQQKRTGTSSIFTVHPCQSGTPAAETPLPERPETPARVAPKPLRTIKGSEANASSLWHALPANWSPTRQLSTNTKAMVENWPPGALTAELESFQAWAANAKPEKGKGLKKDWDDAFGNWIRTAHRDRYSRVVSIQRPRTNPLMDTYRAAVAACQSEDSADHFGTRPALPSAGNG